MSTFEVSTKVYSMSGKNVANQTLDVIKNGAYQNKSGKTVNCAVEIQSSIGGTCLYRPAELAMLLSQRQQLKEPRKMPKIELTTETTAEAARRLYEREGERNILSLNFASAKNPGGGFLGGAKAQEEDLARCSALYSTQLTQREYYDENRQCRTMLYTDFMIYSPDVPFFRDERLEFLESIFLTSILTSPAPNAGQFLRQERGGLPKLAATLERRAGMVLSVAAERGHRVLVLGAWGCGVFQNNPSDVAASFNHWLQYSGFSNAFDRVVFAIYERDKKRPNLSAFEQTFKRAQE